MQDIRQLSYDPETGIREMMLYDDADDKLVLYEDQDVEPVIEQNKLLYNAAPDRITGDGLVRVGSIPMSIYYDLKRRGILDDQKALAKWLNDPENLYVRTRPGRV